MGHRRQILWKFLSRIGKSDVGALGYQPIRAGICVIVIGLSDHGMFSEGGFPDWVLCLLMISC